MKDLKQKIDGRDIRLAPQPALTAATATTINTGDAASDTAITNMRTRINELETRLRTLNFIR